MWCLRLAIALTFVIYAVAKPSRNCVRAAIRVSSCRFS